MQLSDSDSLSAYNHIYLSPHLDDAALSCGGAMLNARRRNERVLVITLCTAAPDPRGPFSALAQEFHAFWALQPDDVVAARLREDRLAMERLGADFVWANFLDAIYRVPEAYTSRESLFGAPAPDDPLLAELTRFVGMLREHAPRATIYAPLGVGFHVDHLITHNAARAHGTTGIVFYEDVPYAAHSGALEARVNRLNTAFQPRLLPISPVIDAKIEAIAAYASQLGELFRAAPMREVVRAYHARVGGGNGMGERVWTAAM